MQKVIVCTGCPASGKSTWATQAIHTLNGGAWVRVNRDDFRAMLNGGDPWMHYKTPREKDIESMSVELRNDAVRLALEHGMNVIVDEVNIRSRAFHDVASIVEEISVLDPRFKCEVTEKVFYVPLDEARIRNARRNQSVEDDVLEKIWTALGGESLKEHPPQTFVQEARQENE